MGERFDRFREAVTGGPRYTPAVGPYASTRDQEKNARKRGRELDLAAGRGRRHRESVFEEKRRWGRRS